MKQAFAGFVRDMKDQSSVFAREVAAILPPEMESRIVQCDEHRVTICGDLYELIGNEAKNLIDLVAESPREDFTKGIKDDLTETCAILSKLRGPGVTKKMIDGFLVYLNSNGKSILESNVTKWISAISSRITDATDPNTASVAIKGGAMLNQLRTSYNRYLLPTATAHQPDPAHEARFRQVKILTADKVAALRALEEKNYQALVVSTVRR